MAYALSHYQNVYPAYMYVHIPCDCQSLFFYLPIVLFCCEHWSQCLYPPLFAMVLPLAHWMMHLLTVLSLSQGCVNLGKISSKILDGVYCKFSFYFLNALIAWFALHPRTINFCTEKCCHFVFIQHIYLDRNFPDWLISHIMDAIHQCWMVVVFL